MVLILGSHVEIIRLDLIEGTPHLILHILAPNTSHDNPYVHPNICGDLVSIGINQANQILLVKLSTAEAILFAINENNLTLINGHMVIAVPDEESGALRLDVFAEESLQQLWKPALIVSPAWRPGEWGDDDGAGESAEEEDEEEQEEATLGRTRWRLVFMRDIQSLVSETINTPEAHSLRRRHLAVHECPMGDGDEYIIWVCCSASSTENQSGNSSLGGVQSSLYKFRLRLPSGRGRYGDQPSMRLLLVTGAQREWPVEVDATYAGHMEMWDWATRRRRILALAELHLTEQDHKGGDDEATSMKVDYLGWLDLDGCGDYVHASAYSGALTYSTTREVIVKYYD